MARNSGVREPVKVKIHHMCCVCSAAFLTLCDSMDCSPPGSSVHGILRARILEWLPFPSPGNLPDPGIEPASLMSLALAGGLGTP